MNNSVVNVSERMELIPHLVIVTLQLVNKGGVGSQSKVPHHDDSSYHHPLTLWQEPSPPSTHC